MNYNLDLIYWYILDLKILFFSKNFATQKSNNGKKLLDLKELNETPFAQYLMSQEVTMIRVSTTYVDKIM